MTAGSICVQKGLPLPSGDWLQLGNTWHLGVLLPANRDFDWSAMTYVSKELTNHEEIDQTNWKGRKRLSLSPPFQREVFAIW